MKLADYLYETKTTPTHFRRMLGGVVTCRSTIWKYLMGERIPQPRVMVAITLRSGGAVRLEDFLDPRPPQCARSIARDDGTSRMILPWSKGWPTDEHGDPLSPSDIDDHQELLRHDASGPDEPCDEAELAPHCDAEDTDMTPPMERALRVLGTRARFTPSGTFLLDGRITDNRRLVKAANEILLSTGQPPIHYPGVENSYE